MINVPRSFLHRNLSIFQHKLLPPLSHLPGPTPTKLPPSCGRISHNDAPLFMRKRCPTIEFSITNADWGKSHWLLELQQAEGTKDVLSLHLTQRNKTFSLSEVIHCYHTRPALRCIKTLKGWINSGLLMSFEFCKDQNAGRTELKAINLPRSTCLLH